jgi:hypothetical protein
MKGAQLPSDAFQPRGTHVARSPLGQHGSRLRDACTRGSAKKLAVVVVVTAAAATEELVEARALEVIEDGTSSCRSAAKSRDESAQDSTLGGGTARVRKGRLALGC